MRVDGGGLLRPSEKFVIQALAKKYNAEWREGEDPPDGYLRVDSREIQVEICGARRMAETAAHLVDHVIPRVSVRQWVLSFPIPLRILFAARPHLLTAVLQIIHRVIATFLIKQAGVTRSEAHTGAVTLIHRFVAFLPFVPIQLKCLKPQERLPLPITLGEHVRKRRQELGLTLKAVGELLETDERSIINWEKGRTVPKVYRLPAIIRFLGYNLLPEPQTVSERLVAKRLERGWSRKAASRQLGIDESTLRGWEQGKVTLFRKHRRLIAKLLGIPEAGLDIEMKARWKNAYGQT
jgi:transcriptional regulator with XRE-family HTH domain